MFDAAERLFRSELDTWEKKREERKRRREAGVAEYDTMFQVKKCYYVEPKREEESGEKTYCARLMVQPELTEAERRLPAPPPPGEELAKALRDTATLIPTAKAQSGMVRINYYKGNCGDAEAGRRRLKKSATKKRLLMSRRCKAAREESPKSSSPCRQDQTIMGATSLADSIVREKFSSDNLALRAW